MFTKQPTGVPIVETPSGSIQVLSLVEAAQLIKIRKHMAVVNKDTGLYEDAVIYNTELVLNNLQFDFFGSKFIPITKQYSTFALDKDMPEYSFASNLRWFIKNNTKSYYFDPDSSQDLCFKVTKMANEIYRAHGNHIGKLICVRWTGNMAVLSPSCLCVEQIWNPSTDQDRIAIIPERSDIAIKAVYVK